METKMILNKCDEIQAMVESEFILNTVFTGTLPTDRHHKINDLLITTLDGIRQADEEMIDLNKGQLSNLLNDVIDIYKVFDRSEEIERKLFITVGALGITFSGLTQYYNNEYKGV